MLLDRYKTKLSGLKNEGWGERGERGMGNQTVNYSQT